MQIESPDENLLLQQIRMGEVVLVLGAGVHQGSTNRAHEEIADSKRLATHLATEMGECYGGEPLPDVVAAFKEMRGREALDNILVKEFRFCRGSNDLERLFKYTWNKLYTWNIDDSLDYGQKESVQRIQEFNGMFNKVESLPKHEILPIIHLHGSVKQLDRGVVFTVEDYSKILQNGNHEWYRELSADYVRSPVIFVGSSMREPILDAEIQRASSIVGGSIGRSYVITPDQLSNIQINSLKQRGLTHIKGSFSDFVSWLQRQIGETLTPADILMRQGFSRISEQKFSRDEISAAHSLYPKKYQDLRAKFNARSAAEKSRMGREFLNGFGPTWELASSDIPVNLEQLPRLMSFLERSLDAGVDAAIIHGQAGSGKTTSTMMALLRLQRKMDFDLYEVSSDIDSLSAAFNFLERFSEKRKVLFISNIIAFSQAIADDLVYAARARATMVTTLRSSEWHDRFERYLAPLSTIFKFERFDKTDHDPLLERLRTFVPAPKFIKLPISEQRRKLEKSKSQLLIALREATESRRFDDVILNEYENLKEEDVRNLFILVGLASLSRAGLDKGAAAQIFSTFSGRSFEDALMALTGIVRVNAENRLVARHELYVRTILNRRVTSEIMFDRISDLLGYYTKFDIPVIQNASRLDGALFRYMLSYRSMLERGHAVDSPDMGLEVFRRFEVEFQLDGHFWLQYGLLMRSLGRMREARRLLEKSIDAWRDNTFAIHALAHTELLEAIERPNYDSETKRLIRSAEKSLSDLLENPHLKINQYPIVTLINFHLGALIEHGQVEDARKLGRRYFEIVSALDSFIPSAEIADAKTRVLKLVTTGVWLPPLGKELSLDA